MGTLCLICIGQQGCFFQLNGQREVERLLTGCWTRKGSNDPPPTMSFNCGPSVASWTECRQPKAFNTVSVQQVNPNSALRQWTTLYQNIPMLSNNDAGLYCGWSNNSGRLLKKSWWCSLSRGWRGFALHQRKKSRLSVSFFRWLCSFDRLSSSVELFIPPLPVQEVWCWLTVRGVSITDITTFKSSRPSMSQTAKNIILFKVYWPWQP